MTNALTPVLQSRALQPVRRTETIGPNHRETDARRASPVYRAAPAGGRPHQGPSAGFITQAIANDNGPDVSYRDAARAYWDMNYRLADLPIGFLVSRAV